MRASAELAYPAVGRVLSWRWLPAAVFVFALLLRAFYLVQAREHPLHDYLPGIVDSLYYDSQASEIAQGEFLFNTPFFLGPLYPFLMGALYALFEPSREVVRWAQALLGAASCAVLFAVGARMFDRRVGLLASLLLAAYPIHLYYTGLILPTVLVLFLHLVLLWILLWQVEAPSPVGAVLAGVVLGLAALTKSNALLLLPVLLVTWLWIERERALRLRLLWSAAFVAMVLATIAPATLHNMKVSERFVLLTTSTGRNLWKGNGPIANGTHPLGHQDRSKAGMGKQMAGAADPELVVDESTDYVERTLAYVGENPGATAALLGKKLVLFFNAVELGIRDQFYFAQDYAPLLKLPFAFSWLAPLGLAGALTAWRRRRVLLLYAMLGVQVVSFVAVFVLARYRIVAVACLLLFASWQVFAWADAVRSARWRAIVPTVLAAGLAAVFVNWPLPEFPRNRGFGLVYEKIGDMHHQAKRNAAALAAYEEALDKDWQGQDPELRAAEMRLNMAREYEILRQYAAAAENLRMIIEDFQPQDLRGVRVVMAAKKKLARLEAKHLR